MEDVIINDSEDSTSSDTQLDKNIRENKERARQDRIEQPELIQGVHARINVLVESMDALSGLTIGADLAFVRAVYGAKIEFPQGGDRGDVSFPLANYFRVPSLRFTLALLQTPPDSRDFEGDEWVHYARQLASQTKTELELAYAETKKRNHLSHEHARALIRGFLEEDGMRAILSQAGEIREKIEEKLQEADAAVKGIAEVAGTAAEGELSRHFAAYATAERKVANLARLSVIALAVAITIFTFIAIGIGVHDLTWLELVRKLSLTLPAVALAAYLARESSRHRDSCNWAETISVQLKTVHAFTESMKEDARDLIRAELGKRIFSSQPPQVNGGHQLSREEIMATVSDIRTALSLGSNNQSKLPK